MVTADELFSPHTRGCSFAYPACKRSCRVFPAYAGMFPVVAHCDHTGERFPRIRGDVPDGLVAATGAIEFSPHTRGCSVVTEKGLFQALVFPAYAGMFPASRRLTTPTGRFPRIRGDVPLSFRQLGVILRFSPHTRGCSPHGPQLLELGKVFPAYAGMFLVGISITSGANRFPRIRGDVPQCAQRGRESGRFSPHTRGCSAWLPCGQFPG